MITILSDKVNSGKSTWCYKWVLEQIKEGREINGWLTLPYLENGVKVGHDFHSIIHSRILPSTKFSRLEEFENSICVGRYFINQDVFQNIAPSIPKEGHFILDEIGALELMQKQGFYPEIKKILNATKEQLFVVQEKYVREFMDMFAGKYRCCFKNIPVPRA